MAYTIEIVESEEAESLCRKITADLPEYFGLPDCNEAYAKGVRTRINFAAKSDGQPVGLLSLEFPYPKTSQIYWMGILKDHHGQGIAHFLMKEAVKYAQGQGAVTMTVETLAPSCCDENYLKTYQFYEKEGFQPLFDRQPAGYEYSMVYMSKDLTKALSDLVSLEKQAHELGFIWPNLDMILDQAISECQEIKEAILKGDPEHKIQEEIGDLLHAAISLCLFAGYDMDQTLLKTTKKFDARMQALKKIMKDHGLENLKGQSIEFMLALWDKAKKLSI